jgi:amino acid transporter
MGLVLYLAQSVSVGFYVVGFVEALQEFLGMQDFTFAPEILGQPMPAWLTELTPHFSKALFGSAVCIVLFLVTITGPKIVTKLQYLIGIALVTAIGSFVLGAFDAFQPKLLDLNAGPAKDGLGFWPVFAIFFPAVTGFTQGVSMSGELKDPAKSLPRGTFLAVGASMLVYLALPFLLAGTTNRHDLMNDIGAATMKRDALNPQLIDIGVFAATISSALASFVGAPRILQAMSLDRLFPGAKLFADRDRPEAEPRRAASLTLLVALACIWGGDLNALAAVVTMFFLLSYTTINLGTFFESFSQNPAFRPRFKLTGWRTSLLGGLICVAVMLAIDPLASVISLAVLFGLYRYLVTRRLWSPAGDARRAFFLQRIKDYLISLQKRPPHKRDWRPVVLAVTKPGRDGRPLAAFAQAIGSGHGILTMAVVLVGRLKEMIGERRRHMEELDRFVRSAGARFFYEVPISTSYSLGIRSLLMSHGVGPLHPNTLLTYWSSELEADYLEVLDDAAVLGHNVVLLHTPQTSSPFSTDVATVTDSRERVIDVWWRSRANGPLALLLAHLVRETDEWHGCTVRLLRIVTDMDHMETAEHDLVELLDTSRIEARVVIVLAKEAAFDVIAEESEHSHLVFMGVGGIGETAKADLARYNAFLERLPTTALVFSAQQLDVAV